MKESRLKQSLGAMIDLIVVGVLWLLCSLPLITLGPASTALYYAVVKCVRHDRGRLTREFFAAFQQNLRLSLPMWLVYLGALLLGLLDICAYTRGGLGGGFPLFALSGVLLIPAALSFPWMFAYLSRFQNSFGGSLKFVLFLTARHLGRSLLLAGELLLFLAISWLIPQLLPLLPGPFALLASLSVEPVFREYTQDQTPPDGDAWYNE